MQLTELTNEQNQELVLHLAKLMGTELMIISTFITIGAIVLFVYWWKKERKRK